MTGSRLEPESLPARPDPAATLVFQDSAMPPRTAAIIVAAGRGLRAGPGGPKQFRSLAGRTVVAHALDAFCGHPEVAHVQPVCHADDSVPFATATEGLRYLPPMPGGATRQASVRAGLRALAKLKPDVVLIHD